MKIITQNPEEREIERIPWEASDICVVADCRKISRNCLQSSSEHLSFVNYFAEHTLTIRLDYRDIFISASAKVIIAVKAAPTVV